MDSWGRHNFLSVESNFSESNPAADRSLFDGHQSLRQSAIDETKLLFSQVFSSKVNNVSSRVM